MYTAIINPICAITKPAHPHIKVVKVNTYRLKTVVQTKERTISICNLTDFGSDLMSDFESSNIIFALSIMKFLNFVYILLFYTNIFKYSNFKILYPKLVKKGNVVKI